MKKILLSLVLGLALHASTTHTAVVKETLSSGGYTYMKVTEGKNTYWIAMTQRDAKVGQSVRFAEQGWMNNFHSKTLNRTFDKILFAADVQNTQTQLQNIKPNIMTSKYQKSGTITIAELVKNRDTYVGKQITVRGKVIKTSEGIIKRNWVHIEDGSSFANFDDLVFTTTKKVPAVGDIVYATGTLTKDKDFGYGYFYSVIVEKSSFKK
jgi:hypothetical protein